MEEEKRSIPLEVRSYVVAQAQTGLKQNDIVELVQSEEQELRMIKAVQKDRTLNATRVSKHPILNPCGLTARSTGRSINDWSMNLFSYVSIMST